MKRKRKYMSPSARYKILKRDNFTCRLCGATNGEAMLEVDHIIPSAEGGTEDDENLRTLCYACNRGRVIEIKKKYLEAHTDKPENSQGALPIEPPELIIPEEPSKEEPPLPELLRPLFDPEKLPPGIIFNQQRQRHRYTLQWVWYVFRKIFLPKRFKRFNRSFVISLHEKYPGRMKARIGYHPRYMEYMEALRLDEEYMKAPYNLHKR